MLIPGIVLENHPLGAIVRGSRSHEKLMFSSTSGLSGSAARLMLTVSPTWAVARPDFKISIGAADKSLIEFKLAGNSQLKRQREKQVHIYEAANTPTGR
jgi:hypothetical protein